MSDKKKPGWFDHPALSLLLAAVWLLLQQSADPANLIFATLLGIGVPRLVHGFLGPALHPRGLLRLLRFIGIVLYDIIVSNVAVARIVLSPTRQPHPAWVPVQLELRHPGAVTLLAAIITTTPGTVSCVVDDEAHCILVHALDCQDPAALAAEIKARYEVTLRELFE